VIAGIAGAACLIGGTTWLLAERRRIAAAEFDRQGHRPTPRDRGSTSVLSGPSPDRIETITTGPRRRTGDAMLEARRSGTATKGPV
jgi:hypothetical protein